MHQQTDPRDAGWKQNKKEEEKERRSGGAGRSGQSCRTEEDGQMRLRYR